jgi:hypothetical protein
MRREVDQLIAHDTHEIERFLSVDVFNAYLGLYTEIEKSLQITSIKVPLFEPSIKKENIGRQTNFLEKLLGGNDLLSWFGHSFHLIQDGSEIVMMPDSSYGIRHMMPSDQLADKYRASIRQVLLRDISDQLDVDNFRREVLEKKRHEIEIYRHVLSRSATESSHGTTISYTKLSDTKYQCNIDLPVFIMQRNGIQYQFKPVKVGLDLCFEDGTVRIIDKPHVRTKKYHHPFVFSGDKGNICYGSSSIFSIEDVSFDPIDYHSEEGRTRAAESIARSLNICRRLLHEGYSSRTLTPVNTLNESIFMMEKSSAIYSKDPSAIVYDNDPRTG